VIANASPTQVQMDGKEQRFCQQCCRFHELAAFDGERRCVWPLPSDAVYGRSEHTKTAAKSMVQLKQCVAALQPCSAEC